MIILDGKKISNDIKDEIAEEVKKIKAKGEKVPHLAAIIVGNDGASLTYVGSKVRSCQRIGFESTLKHLPEETTEEETTETDTTTEEEAPVAPASSAAADDDEEVLVDTGIVYEALYPAPYLTLQQV